MKPIKFKHHQSRLIYESRLAYAVRLIIISSLVASFSIPAQEGVAHFPARNEQGSSPENVKFNSAFMHGISVDVSQYFQGNPNPAGEFAISISLNGKNRGQHNVLFAPVKGAIGAQPCFKGEQLAKLGIKVEDAEGAAAVNGSDVKDAGQCATMEQWIPGASANYIAGDFHLDLIIPQAYLVQVPRGYTDPNSWERGTTVALLDYNSNFYVQQRTGSSSGGDTHSLSGNLGMMAGLNALGWRLRKRINTSLSSNYSQHTQSLLTYIQRDIPVLRSQLTLGDSTTSGDLFDSLTIRGIQLQSDDRMLPDGLRYYTPRIRGLAETNAKVTVTQRGQILYQTTVPPGPFDIDEIGALGYGGDLQVTVTEADGRKKTQVVPFAAPPMLLHQGVARFSVTVGKMQDDSLLEKPGMAQGFYQYGIGNLYTLYGGGQLSDNYAALGLGHAFNTPLGGISMDMTRARSQLGSGKVSSGNSLNIGFSKYVGTTDTDVTLAAYRYSSKGFYSLRDAVLEMHGTRHNDQYLVDYRTRQRFTVNIGQPVWRDGRLNFSGNFYSYWSKRSSASQYTVTYNQSQRHFSWAISASRSYTSDGHNVNNLMLSFSVPLGYSSIANKPAFNTLYSTVTHDNDGATSLQANAIGNQGTQNELSYGVGTSVSSAKSESTQAAVNGNLNYQSQYGEFGSTASVGNSARQLSLSASGSVIAHSGGVTLGPRLGDYPFALVSAPGAEGARLLNGYGSRIDANGYAIVPSLTPYRTNTVAVNTRGLPDTVDVLESEATVIPQMGAAVKVNVKTLVGSPAVLIVRDSKGNPLPIGANLAEEGNSSIGIIGQGGMAFVRGWKAEKDNLYVENSSGRRLCTIYSDESIAQKIADAKGAITQVEVVCH